MFLTILFVNSIYNFSELEVIAWILLQLNNYFCKVDLENIRNESSVIGFQ